ncbi:MAG: hypothetical protein HZC17_01465 [Candidatus Omnitrophica bacterium]|nr:hypothetical protein [Candidatus Omnitrophota bacterium]
MKKTISLLLLIILLITSPALAAISSFKQAEFPKYLPSLGDSAVPVSTNGAVGSMLIHQNYVVKGQNLDLYAKQYMKELRAREWKVRQYIRKSLGNGKANLIISAVHPMEYDLRLVLTNAGLKGQDFRLQLILKKSTKIKRVTPVR